MKVFHSDDELNREAIKIYKDMIELNSKNNQMDFDSIQKYIEVSNSLKNYNQLEVRIIAYKISMLGLCNYLGYMINSNIR